MKAKQKMISNNSSDAELKKNMKNYTVLKNLKPFFFKGDKIDLEDLKATYTMNAIADLILDNYIVRDTTTLKPIKH